MKEQGCWQPGGWCCWLLTLPISQLGIRCQTPAELLNLAFPLHDGAQWEFSLFPNYAGVELRRSFGNTGRAVAPKPGVGSSSLLLAAL